MNFYEFLQFLNTNWQTSMLIKLKNCSFRTSRFFKIDFTQNLKVRKILRFPLCALSHLRVNIIAFCPDTFHFNYCSTGVIWHHNFQKNFEFFLHHFRIGLQESWIHSLFQMWCGCPSYASDQESFWSSRHYESIQGFT